MEIICLILAVILTIFVVINTLGFLTGAPYAPTPKKDLQKLFKSLRLNKNDVIVDLGSGDGRLLFIAAQRGVLAIGYEMNPFLYLLTTLRIKFSDFERVPEIHLANFWKQDLKSATIIFAFILPQFMNRLERKLTLEASKNTKVITYLTNLPNKKPVKNLSGFNIYQF